MFPAVPEIRHVGHVYRLSIITKVHYSEKLFPENMKETRKVSFMKLLAKQSDCTTDEADDKQNDQYGCDFLSLYLQPVCKQRCHKRQEAREYLIHDFTKLQRSGLHFDFQNCTDADVSVSYTHLDVYKRQESA